MLGRNTLAALAVAVLGTAAPVRAQDFPADSTTPSSEELRKLISGKVFSVKVASGNAWRLQINDNGYFYVNVGNFADSGPWTVEDGKWCSKPQKSKASCNEMRLAAGALLLKRDNGEIVTLTPQ